MAILKLRQLFGFELYFTSCVPDHNALCQGRRSRGARLMPIHIFNTFNDPLGNATRWAGVNDTGQIVGNYTDATGTHGFLESGGTYTSLDDPLAAGGATGGTFPSGINNAGQTVGSFHNANGTHGFLLSGGTYTTIDVPFGI